jgi:holo-[acyl-carrier protein] synthase
VIGIDIVKISRIESFIKRFGDKALDRFMSKGEQKRAKNSSSIASIWAAKEACAKALGVGISKEFGFGDVKVKKDSFGKPYLKFKKRVIKKFKIKNSHLSITHDGGLAIAVVVIKGKK